MSKTILFLIMLLWAQISYSFSETQTDWSDGFAYEGPVTDWKAFLYDMELTDYMNTPGEISITTKANLFLDDLQRMVSSTGDIDLDGDIDVVGRCQYIDGLFWLENCDNGTSWQQHFITTTGKYAWWHSLCDFDNDGDKDLLTSWGDYYQDEGQIVVFENTGGSFWPEHIIADGIIGTMSSYDPFCYPVDIDGDGFIDIIGEYWTGEPGYHTLHISWWRNPGRLSNDWIEIGIHNFENGPTLEAMHAGDKDQDGDADVLVNINYYPEDTTFCIEQQASSWVINPINYEHVYMLGFYDFDSDNILDIFINEGDHLFWLKEVTPNSWEYNLIDDSIYSHTKAWAEDYDGDGDIDIYGIEGHAEWWENINGSGLVWQKHMIHPYSAYNSVSLADLNQDGFTDIILGSTVNAFWINTQLHSDTAFIQSQILDVGAYVYWDSISWTNELPPGTDILLQIRTGVDGSTEPYMEEWSDWIEEPGNLSDYVSNYRRYIQYNALLTTSDSTVTPILRDVSISWSATDIQTNNYSVQTTGLSIYPNPSAFPVIQCILAETTHLEIDVFDICGRVVFTDRKDSASPGIHTILPSNLVPGIYFCRMTTDRANSYKSFVVTK